MQLGRESKAESLFVSLVASAPGWGSRPPLRLHLWRLLGWMSLGLDEVFCIRKQITSLHVLPLGVIMSGLTDRAGSILETSGCCRE